MAAAVDKSGLSMRFSCNEQDFPRLSQWLRSIPNPAPTQDYLSIAVVIEQEIAPIIRKQAAQIEGQGNVLSSAITQFLKQTKVWRELDPAFISLLNADETSVKESILFTKTEEKVDRLSKVILFICRINQDQDTLEYGCQAAMEQINETRQIIDGSFTVFAQAVAGQIPSFSHFVDSAESGVFRASQEIINHSIENLEQSRFVLKQATGLVFKRHFDHGVTTKTNGELSVVLDGNKVTAENKSATETKAFIDLRLTLDCHFTPITSCDELSASIQ